MTYSVHTKVNWIQRISSNWEDFFYPSLIKKINKSNSYFDELFSFKVTTIKTINDANEFLLLYDKEIASRKNYIFKKNEQKEILDNKIQGGKNYLLASLYKKDSGKFAGGIIFHILEDKLFFYLRAFDKEIRTSFRSLTTLDFWAEREMYEYAFSQGLKFISHGTDNYPNKGRTGLVLFKLKVGGKPRISKKEHEILELSDEQILEFGIPTFIWTNPDKESFFQKAHLFYKEGSLDESVLTELIKVCQWAKIELILHKTQETANDDC